MFLNAFADRSRPGLPKGVRKSLTLDFIVAERPIYVPGSGPPLAPITVMPAHDKDGFIEDMIQIDKKPMYIVSYEEHPYLRVSVKPQNILEWVSPRTLEEFEFAKTQAEDKALRDELLPKIAAREQKKRLREQGIPVKASRVTVGRQVTKSRKRKRTPSPEEIERSESLVDTSAMPPPAGPGRKRKQVEDEGEKQQAFYISPRRPSLSTPAKQRGLADVMNFESEDDDSFAEDTSLLDRQLNGTTTSRSKLAKEVNRSQAMSPDPLSSTVPKEKISKPKKPVPDIDRRETRSGSISSINDNLRRETRSSSTSGPSHNDSVAAISSREARAIYEKLERKSRAKAGSLTEKYSYFGKTPSKSTQLTTPASSRVQKSTSPSRRKSVTPAPVEDDESEYEVDAILADEYRLDKGKHSQWYLIKWVGDWPNSWEPAENVGIDAIAEYEDEKRVEQAKMERSLTTLNGTMSSGDDGMHVEGKGKGKEKVPLGSGGLSLEGTGQIGAEEDESESDEDELFVKDRSRSRDFGVKKKMLRVVDIPSRGEVIDDDDSDEF